MPLLRYFVLMGGALLALLFVSNAYLPKSPLSESSVTDLPRIRISSDRKWPERVVFDTSSPLVQTVQTVLPAAAPAAPVEVSARAHVRDAFAELRPPEPKQIDQPSDLKKLPAKQQQKRRIAKRRAAPPIVLVAQQPQFGFFGNNTW